MSQVQVNETGEPSQFPSHDFPESVGLRAPQYPQQDFETELTERPNYMEAHAVTNQASNYNHSHLGLPDMYPSPQGTSRRSSVFNSSSDYDSPATPVTYSPWPTSNTSSSAPMYGFPPQSSNVQVFGQLSQGPAYTAQPIDGLPRQASDAHNSDIFAPRAVNQCAVPPHSGFPHYMTDGTSLIGRNIKSEGEHHSSIPQ